MTQISVGAFSLTPMPKSGRSYLRGRMLTTWANQQDGGLLGLREAQAMLRAQNMIPEEIRKYQLYFLDDPSSFVKDQYGFRYVPVLVWENFSGQYEDGKQISPPRHGWYLHHVWVGGKIDSRVRVVQRLA